MKMYKLLTQEMTSHLYSLWEVGKECRIEKPGTEMCTDQVLHCYNHPILAVIFSPIHADIKNPRLFEIEVDKIVNTDQLKFASKAQKIVREIEVPVLTTEQRVEFAIKVAKLVCKGKDWNKWADKWLAGEDRTDSAARSAAWAAASAAAKAAARSAAWAAASAADSTAESAADAAAARSAAWAAASAADAADKNFNQKMIEIAESL